MALVVLAALALLAGRVTGDKGYDKVEPTTICSIRTALSV
jgi:hypothetical protein